MARNKVQLQRLVFIDRAIRDGMKSGRLANCSSMAETYEVSAKSIMRDIDYLKNQCDAPIEYDRRRYGFYYTEGNYQLPAMRINESDLFAICLARKAMRQYENSPLYRRLLSIFNRIEEGLPETVLVDPGWIDDRMSVLPESRTSIAPETWDAVTAGLRRNRRLELLYLKPGTASPTSRLVDPYHTVSYQGEWYLVGHCHLRKEVRTFALSRIREIRETTATFTIPADFSFKDFAGHHFGIFRGDRDYRVEILFAPRHRPYIEEREWHPGQELSAREDGSLLLSFTTNHLFEVKKWVLSWGSGAQVLAPDELAGDIREELRKALQAYT